MSRFQSASGKSNVGARWLNPAALTRISTFPSVWTEACSSLVNDPRSATSQLIRSDRRPRDSISSAITFTSSRRRELGTTSAPASASPRARVRPIPELPPITTATLPLRSSFLYPMVVQERISFPDRDYQLKMVPSSFRCTGRHAAAALTSKPVVHRRVESFALDVAQRHVDRAHCGQRHRPAPPVRTTIKVLPQVLGWNGSRPMRQGITWSVKSEPTGTSRPFSVASPRPYTPHCCGSSPCLLNRSSVSNHSDSPHQPLIGRLRVTHQQQDQNHSDEGNQPRDDHNRVERMGARGLAGVGKMADKFEGNDRP